MATPFGVRRMLHNYYINVTRQMVKCLHNANITQKKLLTIFFT